MISRFEPMSEWVQPHLLKSSGPPNVMCRVSNRGSMLIDFVVKRLASPVAPALNHLRSLDRLIAARPMPGRDDLREEIETAIREAQTGRLGQLETLRRTLDSLAGGLSPELGADENAARWHLGLARAFLLRESKALSWRDHTIQSFRCSCLTAAPNGPSPHWRWLRWRSFC
jgi:hypothetical protein